MKVLTIDLTPKQGYKLWVGLVDNDKKLHIAYETSYNTIAFFEIDLVELKETYTNKIDNAFNLGFGDIGSD